MLLKQLSITWFRLRVSLHRGNRGCKHLETVFCCLDQYGVVVNAFKCDFEKFEVASSPKPEQNWSNHQVANKKKVSGYSKFLLTSYPRRYYPWQTISSINIGYKRLIDNERQYSTTFQPDLSLIDLALLNAVTFDLGRGGSTVDAEGSSSQSSTKTSSLSNAVLKGLGNIYPTWEVGTAWFRWWRI